MTSAACQTFPCVFAQKNEVYLYIPHHSVKQQPVSIKVIFLEQIGKLLRLY